MTVAVWCPGDGLGHLTRAVAALHTLGVPAGDAVLLTSSPWAADPRATAGHRTAPARLPLPSGVELWVDALPCGRGELDRAAVEPAGVVRHLARRLSWSAYQPHLPPDPPRFATTWLTEPVGEEQEAWLRAHSDDLVTLELVDPPSPPPDLDVGGAWLVVHSGPPDEVGELVAYARDTAAAEDVQPRIVVVGPSGHDVLPAWPLFAGAARLITAAGANAVRQAHLHAPDVPHLLLPMPRRWDDQPARARVARHQPVGPEATAPPLPLVEEARPGRIA